MTTKRTNLLAGTLGGLLLLVTAGLVVAQDPISALTPSSMGGTCGAMGGQRGMMGGQGMMGGMSAMHERMGQGGTCDSELMQSLHEPDHSTP